MPRRARRVKNTTRSTRTNTTSGGEGVCRAGRAARRVSATDSACHAVRQVSPPIAVRARARVTPTRPRAATPLCLARAANHSQGATRAAQGGGRSPQARPSPTRSFQVWRRAAPHAPAAAAAAAAHVARHAHGARSRPLLLLPLLLLPSLRGVHRGEALAAARCASRLTRLTRAADLRACLAAAVTLRAAARSGARRSANEPARRICRGCRAAPGEERCKGGLANTRTCDFVSFASLETRAGRPGCSVVWGAGAPSATGSGCVERTRRTELAPQHAREPAWPACCAVLCRLLCLACSLCA